MENQGLESIIRLLNLNFEVMGIVPKEKITIGFEHDNMKNYFLISGILEECLNDNEDLEILGQKLILQDISLVKFLVEVVKEKHDFQQRLKLIILNSRKHNEINKDKDQRLVIAAANAISILVAANISFSQFDLSQTRICGANLNDGSFSHANFTEADLTGVNLENCKLDGALFYKSKMENVRLGVSPETKILSPKLITCCQFSQNLEELVAGTFDGSIFVSDARKTNEIKIFIESGRQRIAKFSPNGKYIVVSGGDVIRLWDAEKGEKLKVFRGHLYNVNTACFSPDSSLILSCSDDETIRIWDVESGSLIKTLEGHSLRVNSVCFSSKGNFIVSGSSDRTIKLWDGQTGNLLKTLEGHSYWIYSVCFSSDDKLILSGSLDSEIKLWDSTRFKLYFERVQ